MPRMEDPAGQSETLLVSAEPQPFGLAAVN
jgi:hypothetical protein